MNSKRKVEIFTAGCPVCANTVSLVQSLAGDADEVTVLDTHDRDTAVRAAEYGIEILPAVFVNGHPADCCAGVVDGVSEQALRNAGIGKAI